MIREMETVRITEAELARGVRSVLAKVEQGSEVIIEQEDHKRRNSTFTLDEDFGRDLEEIIASRQQPWQPPSREWCWTRAAASGRNELIPKHDASIICPAPAGSQILSCQQTPRGRSGGRFPLAPALLPFREI